jgi:DNA polymerase alpha subunit A
MDRSRRQPVQNSGRAKAESALAALRAAREGAGKRALNFEIKEEEAVYDVVDDQQYAEIVKKRRDAGDFVVDGEEGGYADVGEDDYWNHQRYAGAIWQCAAAYAAELPGAAA